MPVSASPTLAAPVASQVAATVSSAMNEDAATDPSVSELSPARLRAAKKAYTTRFLAQRLAVNAGGYHLRHSAPQPGDVVLARIVEIGHHTKLEGPQSRRQALFVGDEILVAYGNRYAPDQFLAEVPADLRRCQLVAAGGLAGLVTESHAKIRAATEIQPLGRVAKPL